MKTKRTKSNILQRRRNRRHDGVTTVPSTPERQRLEDDRLKAQWDEFWQAAIGSHIKERNL